MTAASNTGFWIGTPSQVVGIGSKSVGMKSGVDASKIVYCDGSNSTTTPLIGRTPATPLVLQPVNWVAVFGPVQVTVCDPIDVCTERRPLVKPLVEATSIVALGRLSISDTIPLDENAP